MNRPPATPRIVCLTPVRNEAWILERFLRCASLWADDILIADQHSEDGSRDIARRSAKVRVIDNPGADLDEATRQRLLIDEARRLPGPRLLLALDADEFLSAGAWERDDWRAMLAARPGTVFRFHAVNLRPGLRTGWEPPRAEPWGFMDDGSPHQGIAVHGPRLPVPRGAPELTLAAIRVLHFQYTDWRRMQAKQRWYQCLERLRRPKRHALEIYRQYHHMDAVPRADERRTEDRWLAGYESLGIDLGSGLDRPPYWFDRAILELLETHGPAAFRQLAIWDLDWTALAAGLGRERPQRFEDPRRHSERLVHRWLRATQRHTQLRLVHAVDARLQGRGW